MRLALEMCPECKYNIRNATCGNPACHMFGKKVLEICYMCKTWKATTRACPNESCTTHRINVFPPKDLVVPVQKPPQYYVEAPPSKTRKCQRCTNDIVVGDVTKEWQCPLCKRMNQPEDPTTYTLHLELMGLTKEDLESAVTIADYMHKIQNLLTENLAKELLDCTEEFLAARDGQTLAPNKRCVYTLMEEI